MLTKVDFETYHRGIAASLLAAVTALTACAPAQRVTIDPPDSAIAALTAKAA